MRLGRTGYYNTRPGIWAIRQCQGSWTSPWLCSNGVTLCVFCFLFYSLFSRLRLVPRRLCRGPLPQQQLPWPRSAALGPCVGGRTVITIVPPCAKHFPFTANLVPTRNAPFWYEKNFVPPDIGIERMDPNDMSHTPLRCFV